jgi:putative transposase
LFVLLPLALRAQFAYVANENNGNISAYNIGPNGALTPVPGSPFAAWIKPNLSKPMQWLNAAYSIWYNRKYGRVGPLFQGRFKAILHDRRTHGLVINRYMHLNPVRVKRLGGHEGRGEANKGPEAELSALRVKALREYRWSSYGYYAGTKKTPNWMSTETLLEQLEDSKTKARAEYRKQLERAAAVGQWETEWKEQIKMTLLLGENEFVHRMQKLLKGDWHEQHAVRQSAKGALSWEAITAAVSEVWDGEWQKLSTRHGNGAKAAALHLARNHSDKSLRELGALAGGMQ